MSSSRPVLAYHLIISCYGFWLPNDPRGSNSNTVWADALKPFGPATTVTTRRSVANISHDRTARFAAKQVLRQSPVRFDGPQARAAARGFGQYLEHTQSVCVSCAVMPDHAHFVLLKSSQTIERTAIGLKNGAVQQLLAESLHPYQYVQAQRPKIWARGDRHVFLWSQADIERSIRYVDTNPLKHGLRPQRWSFVAPFCRERE